MKDIIYKVSADDGMGGERHLGTATGDKDDIIKYFQPFKPYKDATIYISEISLVIVTPELANKTKILLAEKERLEKELKEINKFFK